MMSNRDTQYKDTSDKNTGDKDVHEVLSALEYIDVNDMNTPYLLQSKAWACVKEQFGWKAFAMRQRIFPHLESDIMILIRKISGFGVRLGYLAYIPDGIFPLDIVDIEDEQTSAYIEKGIHDALVLIEAINMSVIEKKGIDVFCTRWDMPWICQKNQFTDTSTFIQSLSALYTHYKDTHKSVSLHEPTQPPATIMLDLKKQEDELLGEMKSKTRYNIKLGSKKGIEIIDDMTIDEFYALYETTSERNHIAIHSKAYYRKVYEEINISHQSNIFIYGAKYQGVFIAAIIVIHTDHNDGHNDGKKTGLYLYGASSDKHRNIMPAYALQWHAMTEAKKMGCSAYDMFGVPRYADEHHRMFGIYKFKSGFGGTHLIRLGGFEVFSRTSKHKLKRAIAYALFLLVEKIRLWYYYSYKK